MTHEQTAAVRTMLEMAVGPSFEMDAGKGFAIIHRADDVVISSVATGSTSAYVRISKGDKDAILAINADGGLAARCIAAVKDSRAPDAVALIAAAMRNGDHRGFGILLDGTVDTVRRVIDLLDAAMGEVAELHPDTDWGSAEYEWRDAGPRLIVGSESRGDPALPALPSDRIAHCVSKTGTHCTMRPGPDVPVIRSMLGGDAASGPTITIGPGMSIQGRLDALSRLRCIGEGRKALSALGIR